MKKIYFLVLILCCVCQYAQSQQISARTHIYFNRFTFNPAVAGTQESIPIILNIRRQWVGIEDAPITQTLSSHAYTGKSVGLGAIIYNDAAGPSRNTGINLSLARHFKLDSQGNYWFSFGMSLLLYQYFFDAEKMRTEIPNDPAVARLLAESSKLTPDINAGVYVNSDDWFVGFSTLYLLQTDQDIFSLDFNPNTAGRTYYLMGGYKFKLTEPFAIEPSFLAKAITSAPIQVDVILKGYYQRHWLGFAYRTSDAIAVLLGISLEGIEFGYSYDFTVSDVQDFSSGTHEVSLAFLLYDPVSRKGNTQFNRSRFFNKRRSKRR